MHWERKKNINNSQAFEDSELIVNQVRGQNASKNDFLKSYKKKLWNLIEYFETFNINFIPRKNKEDADNIIAIGATFDIAEDIKKDKAQPHIKVVVRPVVLENNTIWYLFESDK